MVQCPPKAHEKGSIQPQANIHEPVAVGGNFEAAILHGPGQALHEVVQLGIIKVEVRGAPRDVPGRAGAGHEGARDTRSLAVGATVAILRRCIRECRERAFPPFGAVGWGLGLLNFVGLPDHVLAVITAPEHAKIVAEQLARNHLGAALPAEYLTADAAVVAAPKRVERLAAVVTILAVAVGHPVLPECLFLLRGRQSTILPAALQPTDHADPVEHAAKRPLRGQRHLKHRVERGFNIK